MKPDQVIEEVKKSYFSLAGVVLIYRHLKWSFIPKNNDKPKYMVILDESEPGTGKDRVIIEKTPFLLMEGIAISKLDAIGSST